MTVRFVRANEIDPEITIPENRISQDGVSSRGVASHKDAPSLISRDHISADELVCHRKPDETTICLIHDDLPRRGPCSSRCSTNGVAKADLQIDAEAAIRQWVYAGDICTNKVTLHEIIVNRGVVSSDHNRVTSTS